VSSEIEIIDAFVDGERVDSEAIKRALADPEGRAYMVDAWLLREAMQEDRARTSSIATVPVRSARPAQRWLIAAGIAAGLISGYATGRITGQAAQLPAALPTTTAVAQPSPAFPVPAATRVIQLEFHAPRTTGGD
jgi:hypothetical protein